MSTERFDLRYVDQYSKMLISQFVRNAQQLLPLNNSYYNITPLVTMLVIKFYYSKEIFSKSPDDIYINKEGDIASYSTMLTWRKTVYGRKRVIFSPMIYSWTIKIFRKFSNWIVTKILCFRDQTIFRDFS
eukprot:UN03648